MAPTIDARGIEVTTTTADASRDELIGLADPDYLGTAARTDALLDELAEIDRELRSLPRWRIARGIRLRSDKLSYTAELQHNERIRLKKDLT